MYGTQPVHSLRRCPRISSSSASANNSEARGLLTRDRLPQLLHLFGDALELRTDADVAVLPPIASIGDAAHRLRIGYRMQVLALHDPTLGTLAVPEMRFAREDQRHLEVLGFDRAGVHERIVVRAALEDLVDVHASSNRARDAAEDVAQPCVVVPHRAPPRQAR